MKVQSFGVIPLIRIEAQWNVFLILHRAGNHWGFPKGRKEESETHLEAAKRELREETGLSILRLLKPEPLEESYIFHKKHQTVSKTVFYFLAEVTGSVNLQEKEVSEGKWVALNEAAKHIDFPEAKSLCQEVIRCLENLK